MESYEKMLENAYKQIKRVESSERFEIPKVSGQVAGKNTIIDNIHVIASYLRRPVEQIVRFLQKELAVAGKLEKDRIIFNTKLNSQKVNEKIEMYAKEFVFCPVCSKPDTEIVSEKGIKFRHCLACGAKSPIKYHI